MTAYSFDTPQSDLDQIHNEWEKFFPSTVDVARALRPDTAEADMREDVFQSMRGLNEIMLAGKVSELQTGVTHWGRAIEKILATIGYRAIGVDNSDTRYATERSTDMGDHQGDPSGPQEVGVSGSDMFRPDKGFCVSDPYALYARETSNPSRTATITPLRSETTYNARWCSSIGAHSSGCYPAYRIEVKPAQQGRQRDCDALAQQLSAAVKNALPSNGGSLGSLTEGQNINQQMRAKRDIVSGVVDEAIRGCILNIEAGRTAPDILRTGL